jgi:hypothetical protein
MNARVEALAHDGHLASSEGLRRAVLELHAPKFSFSDRDHHFPYCEGCDPGTWAEEPSDFPCATYLLARDWPNT